MCYYIYTCINADTIQYPLRKRRCVHHHTNVTPDLHLTYSKNGGNLGLVLNNKKWRTDGNNAKINLLLSGLL